LHQFGIADARAEEIGRASSLQSVGFKHGRWLDTVLLQLTLGAGDTALPDIRAE
jgi:phosphinothricin acetyltransferase